MMKVFPVQMVKKLRGRESLPGLHIKITLESFFKNEDAQTLQPRNSDLIGLGCILVFFKVPWSDLNVPSGLGSTRLKHWSD